MQWIKFSFPLNAKLVFREDLEPSVLRYFLPTRNIDFHYSVHSNPVNSFCFHVALKSDPPPFCKVPAECFCSVARRWKVTAGWHGNWEQVTAGGGNSTHRSTSTPAPPQNPKAQEWPPPERHPRPTNPLPLPGGFVPGMGEGSWEGNIVLSLSTHHRPLGVPCLRAWRWGRRECFRRLTHHIPAPSRHPSWAPDGRAGLHSWWARWLARASCPWCSRRWSPRSHRRPTESKKEEKEDAKSGEVEKRDRVAGEDGRERR